MGNLFFGFPVPRAKIADMISSEAAPIDHAFDHIPLGSDPIILPGDISVDEIVKWNGTKFVGTAAPADDAFPSPISIHPSYFNPVDDTVDYFCNLSGLRRRSDIASGLFYAPVDLPHGVTVTKLTVFAYLNHANTKCWVTLYRVSDLGVIGSMAVVLGEWVDGDNSGYDDSISFSTIDNVNYSYAMYCTLDPYSVVTSAILRRVMIDFE